MVLLGQEVLLGRAVQVVLVALLILALTETPGTMVVLVQRVVLVMPEIQVVLVTLVLEVAGVSVVTGVLAAVAVMVDSLVRATRMHHPETLVRPTATLGRLVMVVTLDPATAVVMVEPVVAVVAV